MDRILAVVPDVREVAPPIAVASRMSALRDRAGEDVVTT
jgi:hypothetical protein